MQTLTYHIFGEYISHTENYYKISTIFLVVVNWGHQCVIFFSNNFPECNLEVKSYMKHMLHLVQVKSHQRSNCEWFVNFIDQNHNFEVISHEVTW